MTGPAPDTPVPPMGTADLSEAVRALRRASVLVVGDAMLDRYVYGTVNRISPEAPVPVLSVEREVAMPGGAGNVVRNLTALGAAVAFVSVVGDDQAGSDLTGLVGGQPGVEPWLLVQGGRATTVKTRYVSQGQQLLRSDREVTEPIHDKLAAQGACFGEVAGWERANWFAPAGAKAEYLGIFVENDPTKRLMVIVNYNNDIGDYMEWSGQGYYAINFSNDAYKLATNYVVYALSH